MFEANSFLELHVSNNNNNNGALFKSKEEQWGDQCLISRYLLLKAFGLTCSFIIEIIIWFPTNTFHTLLGKMHEHTCIAEYVGESLLMSMHTLVLWGMFKYK